MTIIAKGGDGDPSRLNVYAGTQTIFVAVNAGTFNEQIAMLTPQQAIALAAEVLAAVSLVETELKRPLLDVIHKLRAEACLP